MRLIKAIIAIVFVSVILGNVIAEQENPDDISEYYGFDEIEIIKLNWGIKDLRIADFNGDGRNDIAVVNNRKAKIELLIQKEAVGPGETAIAVDPNDIDINAITPPTRFARESVPVSQKVFSFICGDLNSDGMMDLAFYGEPKGLYVILQKAPAASILRSKTAGAEADKLQTLSWRTRKKIKIDDGLLTSDALVCADLNNDGAVDLALAGRDAVYIIVQKEDGSLAEPAKYPTATAAQTLGVKVGDLNGDNINDLILITNDSEKPIRVRFGLGTPKRKEGRLETPLETGQLGPEVQFFIEKPYKLKLYNLDKADGDEILTVDSRSGRLICYKFSAENESGADWPILFYPLASGEGQRERDMVVGDFDGDSLVDVAISDPGAAELIFYKQIASLGLAEPVRFPAFADITGLSAADIDGDGKTEMGVLSVKEKVIGVSEFENDRLSFPKPVDLTGEPLAMELADVDYDGTVDCIYISKDANDIRSLRIIYNLSAKMQNRTEGQAAKDVLAVELKKLVSNPDGLKVVDVDQDGLADVLIFTKYEPPISIRQTKRKEFELIDSPRAQASLIKDATLRSIAVADVDGQPGAELLVAQKNFARSLVFADGESWSVIDQYNAKSTENKISAVAAFDIDGEDSGGRPAILLLDGQKGQLQVLKAGADKTYRFKKELDVGRWNGAATHLKWLFASLTGTEVKSVLLFDSEKFALITPPSNSRARRNLGQQFSYETKIKDGIYGNLTAGDINSDGQPDIIMVEHKRNHIEILALDSEAEPTPAMRFKIFEQKSYRGKKRGKSSVEPRELNVADVTGDGKNDLVTIIHDRIIIYPQD